MVSGLNSRGKYTSTLINIYSIFFEYAEKGHKHNIRISYTLFVIGECNGEFLFSFTLFEFFFCIKEHDSP